MEIPTEPNSQTPNSGGQPVVPKTETEKTAPTQNPEDLRRLRTYEADLHDAIRERELSAARIMMLEQQKRQGEDAVLRKEADAKKQSLKLFAFSLAFIVLGLGVIAFVTYGPPISSILPFLAKTIPAPAYKEYYNSILEIDSREKIPYENQSIRTITENIVRNISIKKTEEIGQVKEILLYKTREVQNGEQTVTVEESITTREFLEIFGSAASEDLKNSFDSAFAFGTHATEVGNRPFIIIPIKNFDVAFSGMLKYENRLAIDLQNVFYQTLGFNEPYQNVLTPEEPLQEITDVVVATNTATSSNATSTTTITATTSTSTLPMIVISTSTQTTDTNSGKNSISINDLRNFTDKILRNQDTRAILDKDGKVLFFYTFLNQKNLLIADNEKTIDEVTKRINNLKLVR